MDTGTQLIAAAKAASEAAKDDLDFCMLQSMAGSFRYKTSFSFNAEDMADLLERVAADLAIRPTDAVEGE